MDKRTIQVVLLCMLALFGVQAVVNKIYPPVPQKLRPVPLTNAVTKAAPTNVVAAAPVLPSPPPPPVQHGPEHVLMLSNSFVHVEFTSWGGAVKSVELLRHKGNGQANTILRGPALLVNGSSNDVFSLEQTDARTVVLRGDGITKTVSLGSNYVMQVQVKLANAGQATTAFISTGVAAPGTPKEPPNYLIADWQGGPKWSDRTLSKIIKRVKTGENHEKIQAHWIAVKSQYFLQVLSSPTNALSITYEPVTLPMWADLPKSPDTNGVTALMEVPLTNGTFAVTYYAGPKDYDRLEALGQNQEEAMDYGSWMDFYSGIFGLILLRSLSFFYGIIPSYGIAICLVTIALKLLFWPIQAKSYKSMKAMQKFQPHIAKLKEKYKDDSARLNQETMKLYKEHRINPFAGCLPMLVQLPVLFAFYRLLMCDIALRGVPFLWIKDLSMPDTVGVIAGIAINPLPIIMTATGILQQRLTPTTGDAQQAKMMMFMPLIMLMFFYHLASGLTLYYTLQQLLSILQQWMTMRKDKPTGALVPAGKPK